MASKYDWQTRKLIYDWSRESSAPIYIQRKYKHHFNCKQAPTANAIKAIIRKFNETGNLNDKTRSGRPSLSSDPTTQQTILRSLENNPSKSVRKISYETNISKSLVHKVLTAQLHYYPYKPHYVEAIKPIDLETRRLFAERTLALLAASPEVLSNIDFSDESIFRLVDTINSQNTRIWSEENPNFTVEKPGHCEGTMVWCAISKHGLIGPYFFENSVNQHTYLEMLTNFYIPTLHGRHLYLQNQWFQQDGATAHCANIVTQLLTQRFEDRVFDRTTQRGWPPRSPDLNPCDFYLWGRLKSIVYSKPVTNLEALKDRIREACRALNKEEIGRAVDDFPRRLHFVTEAHGGHIEHLL